jgi:ribosomal protein L16 Arg81 hydroxylase
MNTQSSSRALAELERLIAPFPVDDFLRDYWQKQVLHVRRQKPDFYADHLTIDDIDRLLSGTALPASQVNVGQNAVGVPNVAYSAGGYISPAEVLRLHRAGNTIILRAMHLWLPKVRELCAAMEEVFACEAQANLYLTPANTQSSYPHWDAHDIFVIQIAGSKRWTLHEAPMVRPLHTYEFDRARHPVGPEIAELCLHAGDIAYLPRGAAHNPKANDYSVHIALGVKVRTWADLFACMYENIVTSDAAFREALPVRYGTGSYDLESCLASLGGLAKAFAERSKLAEAVAKLESTFAESRHVQTEGALKAIAAGEAVGLETVVKIPRGAANQIKIEKDSCNAMINGVRLRVDKQFAESLAMLDQNGSCRVADLPAQSDAHRLALAQKLVDEGCLVALSP